MDNKKLYISEYENKILKGILFLNQLERWVPGCSHPHTEQEHESRYKWVSKFSKGKIVLDLACGTGKGSYIIASSGKAKKVIGGDIHKATVQYAIYKYAQNNLNYKVIDAEKIENVQIKPDLVVSFETIEHLKNPMVFLSGVKKILNEGGKLIISTPISELEHNPNPYNQYHVQEWNIIEFSKLVSIFFQNIEVYQQVGDKTYQGKTIFDRILPKKNRKPYQIYRSIDNKQFGNYQIIIASN